MQHIHILGICGTFMGSLAQLAKAKGYRVTGSDLNVYPPMSTQLRAAGIELIEGWGVEQLELNPDMYVIGNVIGRSNPVMEAILDKMLPFTSGPQWLAEHVLQGKWVMAVSGTHGKTTTSSMLAWILQYADMEPGYLIGGVPNNFSTSARLGGSDFFVIEADEYDSAFFDKRSKFVHYFPRTLVINNLEFDHADIFTDLAAIQTQFHHLVRTVAQNGLIVTPYEDRAINQVLDRGCWTPVQTLNLQASADLGMGDWGVDVLIDDGRSFSVYFEGQHVGQVDWSMLGQHNIANAMAAIAAARNVGVLPEMSCAALCEFSGVKRRLEILGEAKGRILYDDFAHHPTAIKTTVEGLRNRVGSEQICLLIEPRSNTMKQGIHGQSLIDACKLADRVIWFEPDGLSWSIEELTSGYRSHTIVKSIDELVTSALSRGSLPIDQSNGDGQSCPEHIVVMSNGGFGGVHEKLLRAMEQL